MTTPAAALLEQLPSWATLLRAPNRGPMTLDGTNTWVLRGTGAEETVIVDPGPDNADHLAIVAEHRPVAGILLTHAHPDHAEGVASFQAMTGAELRALADGEQWYAAGVTVTAIVTPGHTADSVSYLVEASGQRAMLTGDTILGRGTTVVAWPDGDLGAYLSSLERLATFDGIPALPGHGPALADCGVAARYYLSHRRARLEQVRAVVASGVRTPADVVAAVYADVDRSLWPAAEWSVRAQLAYLESVDPPPWLEQP